MKYCSLFLYTIRFADYLRMSSWCWNCRWVTETPHKAKKFFAPIGAPDTSMLLVPLTFHSIIWPLLLFTLRAGASPGQKYMGWHITRASGVQLQSPWSGGKTPPPPLKLKDLAAFGCSTETSNLPESPYFANWRVKLQTWPTP